MTVSNIKEQLSYIPTLPGVYIMKGEGGQVLYVGKAVNLRNRVRSYFQASSAHSPRVDRLVRSVADLEFIVTSSEVEALILECTLIKRHRPPYNIRFKDDKRYPYIVVTWDEDFPRVQVVRRTKSDGSRYFGPYASSSSMRQTLELLRSIFPYVTCNRRITGTDRRACLYYHIERCTGPCIGAISREEYRDMMRQVCLFLEGKGEEILAYLEQEMATTAENLEFEKAARLRDQIQAVDKVVKHQRVVSTNMADQDVIAFARGEREICIQVFFVRAGKLIGRDYFLMDGADGAEGQEILASFVKQFYDKAVFIPPEILLSASIDEGLLIQRWLQDKKGTKVTLRVPRRGRKKELVQMAEENATETLAHLMAKEQLEESKALGALAELQEQLGLDDLPMRIEAYDISNIQGFTATGSMIVFAQGNPQKSDYRRFRIRTVEGSDDYAMMQEVLRRRFRKAVARQETARDTWATLPDLIVIDGGKGQLNAAVEVLTEHGLEEVPVIGLAKAREEVFRPGEAEPLILPLDSQGLQLLQRVRDEAHRFAVAYHRRLRREQGLASTLEEIPGIGPKRRQALLKRFGSLEAIRQASINDLAAVEGMNRMVARKVHDIL